MTADASGGLTFRVAADVDPEEAGIVIEALGRAGWRQVSDEPCALVWLGRDHDSDGVSQSAVVNRIPGLELLRSRDAVTAGIRRSRARSRTGDDRARAGLLDTFATPADVELLAVARRGPSAGAADRWTMRPTMTTAGGPEAHLGPSDEPPLGGTWCVQRGIEPYRAGGLPAIVRVLAVVVGLEPLLVHALGGALREVAGGDRETALRDPARFFVAGPADGTAEGDRAGIRAAEAARIVRALGALAAEAVIGCREQLLLQLAQRDAPVARGFQIIGVTALLGADLRPWLLDVETEPLSRWVLPRETAVAAVRGAVATLAHAGAAAVTAGEMTQVAPDLDPTVTLAALALPRPADIALAGAVEPALTPASGVRGWYLADGLVLHVPRQGRLLCALGPSSFVWAALAEGLGPGEIASELAQELHTPLDATASSVRGMLAEWIETGAVARDGLAAGDPGRVSPPAMPLRTPRLRWNVDRAYSVLGAVVVARLPSRELGAWCDLALAGLAAPAADVVDAFVDVTRTRDGFMVSGTHRAARLYASEHQLPSAVRAAVLASAGSVTCCPAFTATALVPGPPAEAEPLAVVVVGVAEARANVATAWTAAGGLVLTDEIVAIDEGLRVLPTAAGMRVLSPNQWIDGTPKPWGSDGAPLVDDEGLVTYRFASAATRSNVPARVRAVLFDGGAAGEPMKAIPAGPALAELLSWRAPGRAWVSAEEAGRIVDWVETVDCRLVSLADPAGVALELRALPNAAVPG